MTKRVKIISGLVLGTVLATSLYAGHGDRGNCEAKKGEYKKHMMKKRAAHGMGMPIFKMAKELKLTDEQKTEIKGIFKEQMKNKETLADAFTSTSFDKEKFIKIMSEKRENMLKSKADTMEKVYAVLDSTQKEKLKTLLDEKKEKRLERLEK